MVRVVRVGETGKALTAQNASFEKERHATREEGRSPDPAKVAAALIALAIELAQNDLTTDSSLRTGSPHQLASEPGAL